MPSIFDIFRNPSKPDAFERRLSAAYGNPAPQGYLNIPANQTVDFLKQMDAPRQRQHEINKINRESYIDAVDFDYQESGKAVSEWMKKTGSRLDPDGQKKLQQFWTNMDAIKTFHSKGNSTGPEYMQAVVKERKRFMTLEANDLQRHYQPYGTRPNEIVDLADGRRAILQQDGTLKPHGWNPDLTDEQKQKIVDTHSLTDVNPNTKKAAGSTLFGMDWSVKNGPKYDSEEKEVEPAYTDSDVMTEATAIHKARLTKWEGEHGQDEIPRVPAPSFLDAYREAKMRFAVVHDGYIPAAPQGPVPLDIAAPNFNQIGGSPLVTGQPSGPVPFENLDRPSGLAPVAHRPGQSAVNIQMGDEVGSVGDSMWEQAIHRLPQTSVPPQLQGMGRVPPRQVPIPSGDVNIEQGTEVSNPYAQYGITPRQQPGPAGQGQQQPSDRLVDSFAAPREAPSPQLNAGDEKPFLGSLRNPIKLQPGLRPTDKFYYVLPNGAIYQWNGKSYKLVN